jgi:hypothetical protein
VETTSNNIFWEHTVSIFRIVSASASIYTALYPTRSEYSSSLLWDPQISQLFPVQLHSLQSIFVMCRKFQQKPQFLADGKWAVWVLLPLSVNIMRSWQWVDSISYGPTSRKTGLTEFNVKCQSDEHLHGCDGIFKILCFWLLVYLYHTKFSRIVIKPYFSFCLLFLICLHPWSTSLMSGVEHLEGLYLTVNNV